MVVVLLLLLLLSRHFHSYIKGNEKLTRTHTKTAIDYSE